MSIQLSKALDDRINTLLAALREYPAKMAWPVAMETNFMKEYTRRDGTKGKFAFKMNTVEERHLCGTAGCAIGLDRFLHNQLHPHTVYHKIDVQDMMTNAGFAYSAGAIFYDDARVYGRGALVNVTPEQVVKQLEKFLKDPGTYEAEMRSRGGEDD